MNLPHVQIEFEPSMFMILPSIALLWGECECCGEENFCIQAGWISWVIVIDFGGEH